jgi:Protein of unknown function (DUF3426)
MATNPQSPPPKGPQLAPRMHVPRKKQFPWPIVVLLVAAALLLIIVVKIPTTPKKVQPPSAAQIPPQPTAGQVELSNVTLTPSPVGGALALQAMLHNNGNTDITGIQVQGTFHGSSGQVVGSQNAKVQALKGPNTSSEELTISPIKPNQSIPVRIQFEQEPANWDKRMPELKVTEVTATKP